jgi:predicted TIM-barrel fold metal-dependent hydrolase
VIDTCVHHRWEDELEVLEHLDQGWRGYVGTPKSLPGGAGMRQWVPRLQFANPAGEDLPDARDATGASLASSPQRLAAAAVEPRGVERALLLFDRGMFVPAGPNPHLALAMTRAINDWNLDRWLSRDERLFGVVLVPCQTPEEGAAEIRRVGGHERIAAILLATAALGKTLGHPVYDPIFRAAVELGLPLVLHRGGDAVPDTPTGPAGGPR